MGEPCDASDSGRCSAAPERNRPPCNPYRNRRRWRLHPEEGAPQFVAIVLLMGCRGPDDSGAAAAWAQRRLVPSRGPSPPRNSWMPAVGSPSRGSSVRRDAHPHRACALAHRLQPGADHGVSLEDPIDATSLPTIDDIAVPGSVQIWDLDDGNPVAVLGGTRRLARGQPSTRCCSSGRRAPWTAASPW